MNIELKALSASVQIWRPLEQVAVGLFLRPDIFRIVRSKLQTAAKSTIWRLEICPLLHGKSYNVYQLIDKKKLDKIVLKVGFGRGA